MSLRYSFFAIVPDGIIEIPQGSNLSWLTLFYALPKELVEKYPPALSLPRNIYELLDDPDSMEVIKNDMFLLLVWDCFAWSAWQFFQVPNKDGTYKDIPGDWKNYSGDFPLWRLSYEIIKHFRKKFETEMDWSFQRLFLMDRDDEHPWLTYQQFSNLIGNLTDMIVAEENWQPMIDEFWNNRNPDDYSGSSVHKRDFNRSWYHDRNHKHLSIEEIAETGAMIDGEMLFDIPNPAAEFETKVLQKIGIEQFERRLTEQDKQILRMRMDGCSLKDIAAAVGFKTPRAVSKHIEKIAGAYEDYVSGEYGSFLDKHYRGGNK